MINKILGITENASEHGALVDHTMGLVHWFMVLLGVGWGLFFLICLFKFHHRRNPKADYYGIRGHASTHLEIGVVIVEAVLLLGFAFPLWAKRVSDYPVGADVVEARIVGYQFGWFVHYPGPDGKFGRVAPVFYSNENPVGIDPRDPNGDDDFVVNELIVREGFHAVVGVTSRDVIHNVHLPSMRIAQDAIPGTESHMNFRPIKSGEFEIICGQLCGTSHAAMTGRMIVKTGDEFEQWWEEETGAQLLQAEPELTQVSPSSGVPVSF